MIILITFIFRIFYTVNPVYPGKDKYFRSGVPSCQGRARDLPLWGLCRTPNLKKPHYPYAVCTLVFFNPIQLMPNKKCYIYHPIV